MSDTRNINYMKYRFYDEMHNTNCAMLVKHIFFWHLNSKQTYLCDTYKNTGIKFCMTQRQYLIKREFKQMYFIRF